MSQRSMAPLGTQISYALKARGVEVVFGIPGVHNQELYRGLEEAGLRHILARHAQGAGFMADGYARATGRAGVAFVITGPGLCNIMTALGQAYSDSVPLLVFSSCLDDIEARKGQLLQMKDQLAAAATVCDWSELAQSDAQAYRLMDQAFAEFAHQRPRPSDTDHVFGRGGASPAGCATAALRPGASGGGYRKSCRDAALGEKAVGYFRGGGARGYRDAVIAAAGCCKLYHLRRAGGGCSRLSASFWIFTGAFRREIGSWIGGFGLGDRQRIVRRRPLARRSGP